ncbi:MAG: radical SAM protein [Selenomonadaceae bacterium]|nr:radical SAM protein [Selenomonadaceae bacterium]
MKKRFGQVKTYEDWCTPKIVSNTLELLDKEIPRLKDKIHSVHLCFTTDPFMYKVDEVIAMSLASIKKLNAAGISCRILTKGLLPAELAHMSKENECGITLISLNEDYRAQMEPNTSPYLARIAALKFLHEVGCKTWVCMEPYPTPNLVKQDLRTILDKISFVDKIIFGKMNYNKEITAYKGHKEFYNDCAAQVKEFCAEHGMDCYIKIGTET